VRFEIVLLCPYNTSSVLVGAFGQAAGGLQALLLTAAGIIWRTIRGGRAGWAAVVVVGNSAHKIPNITTILSAHREW